MKVSELGNDGVLLLQHDVFNDKRGGLTEIFNSRKFADFGFKHHFKQTLVVRSKHNVLRGLHYQNPPQGKLLTVLHGTIYDVSVNIETGDVIQRSLFGDQPESIFIPPGLAHGYYVLSDTAIVQYMTTQLYRPKTQYVIPWDSEDYEINWPIPGGVEPILSDRDAE